MCSISLDFRCKLSFGACHIFHPTNKEPNSNFFSLLIATFDKNLEKSQSNAIFIWTFLSLSLSPIFVLSFSLEVFCVFRRLPLQYITWQLVNYTVRCSQKAKNKTSPFFLRSFLSHKLKTLWETPNSINKSTIRLSSARKWHSTQFILINGFMFWKLIIFPYACCVCHLTQKRFSNFLNTTFFKLTQAHA